MDKRITKMVQDIASEIDYDIYKENYLEETAEEPECVEENIETVFNIIKRHLQEFSGNELFDILT